MNPLDFASDGAWEDLAELSNDMIGYDPDSRQGLGDTCKLYPFSGGATTRSTGPVSNTFGTPILGIPVRVDVDVKGLIPQRMKDNIEAEKVIRYIFMPILWLTDNNVMPKIKDELETTAGRPLGDIIRYRVLDVNTETDQVDVTVLVEEVV